MVGVAGKRTIETHRITQNRLLICIALIVQLSYPLFGFDEWDTLTGEFWVELDPAIKEDQSYPLTSQEAAEILLDEARFVFSGMIYGFEFEYTPYDQTRGVEEIFNLDPIAEIPWGDPALTVVQMRVSNNRRFALIRYAPKDHQIRWLQAWESNINPKATGLGKADLFKGVDEKRNAFREAIKEAVRGYLRQRILNKPKEIRGELVLADVPYVIIDAGTYLAKTEVRLRIDEVIPYRQY